MGGRHNQYQKKVTKRTYVKQYQACLISVVRFVLTVFGIESIYILEPAYEVPDPSFYLPFEMFFISIQTMPKPIYFPEPRQTHIGHRTRTTTRYTHNRSLQES